MTYQCTWPNCICEMEDDRCYYHPEEPMPERPLTVADPKSCSFCGKGRYQATLLITEGLATICDECVDTCARVVAHYRTGNLKEIQELGT